MRRGGFGFDLLAQLADQHAQIGQIVDVRRAPDGGEQLAVGEHPAVAFGQPRQELVLLRREPHRLAGPADQPPHQVDLQLAGADHRIGPAALQLVAQRHAQPGEEFADPERLLHVVVGAQVERSDLFDLAVACREHQHRAGVEGAGGGEQLLAVHVRQAEVEHHRVGRGAGDLAQAVGARVGAQRLETGGGQRRREEPVHLRLVVDDQDAGPVGAHSSQCGVGFSFGRLIRIRVPRP